LAPELRVDIIAFSQNASRMVHLQVKALRDRNSAVPCHRHMVEGRRPVLVDYWIIVSGLGTNDPEFFIATPRRSWSAVLHRQEGRTLVATQP